MNDSNDKLYAILSYIGPLVLVPILAEKKTDYVRFHANQGLVLLVCGVALNIALSIVRRVLRFLLGRVLGGLIGWGLGLLGFVVLALMIYGIYNAATLQEKRLPIIGELQFLK